MEFLLLGIIIGILIVKISYGVRYYFFFRKNVKNMQGGDKE